MLPKKYLSAIFIASFLLFPIAAMATAYPWGVGGTGNTTYSANSLITSNGSNQFVSTSTNPLYVGSLFATTTATSTFTGGLNAFAINQTGTASSTFARGITLTGGCFAYNNVCITQNSGTVTSVATNNGLTGGTITTSGTIGLAQIAANSLLANNTNALGVPIAVATSTLYGVCSGGQVVGWSNVTGGLMCIATSTASGGSGTVGSGTTGQMPYYAGIGTTLTSTSSIFLNPDQSTSFANSVVLPLGLVGTPSLTFTGDLNTGIFSAGADQLSLVTGSTARLTVSSAQITPTVLMAPGTGGTYYLRVTAPTGSAPAYSFVNDIDTGMSTPSAGIISFINDSAESLRIDTLGNVGIASSTLTAKFAVEQGTETTSFLVANQGSSTPSFTINGANGDGRIGIATSTSSARLTLDNNNGTASSSIVVYEYRPTATSTSGSISCNSSNTTHWRMGSAATTLTLTDIVPGQNCTVIVENPNQTAGAITWAVSSGKILLWANNTTPTQTTTANTHEVWSFKATLGSSTVAVLGAQTPNFK